MFRFQNISTKIAEGVPIPRNLGKNNDFAVVVLHRTARKCTKF